MIPKSIPAFPFMLLLLSLSTLLQAQKPYFPKYPNGMGAWNDRDTMLMVINREGMPYEGVSQPSDRGILPFGTLLTIAENYGFTDTIQYRTGIETKMKFKSQIIRAFTGFLSDLKVPDLKDEDVNCQNLRWFEKLVRANVGKSVYKGKKNYGYKFQSAWEQFDDESLITYFTGPDFEDLIMESTNLDMNDVINLLDYYTHKVKSKCLPKDDTDASAPQFNMKITRDSNREVIRVECPDMDFVASKSYYKIILKMRIR